MSIRKSCANFLSRRLLIRLNKDADLTIVKPEKFRFPSGATAVIEHALTKVALAHLGSIWTSSIQFDELMNLSRKTIEEKGIVIEDWEKERKHFMRHLA